ncbi:Sec-independent protein translocase protein TatB [Antrihabitans stalactiti]|uniref:Sec-independent protein translocase protein TatB n=1 Tax=Antrihabitans stalactiti TaxID=2584121 RepID=A0A848KFG9_9NOCA|nr:Sec-independent protein translocase protein TatB [Antrihabitans stalactiti]NMN97713.1 Sec-independent protein translocase subunit TatB [Antrihabitans stalactiti]
MFNIGWSEMVVLLVVALVVLGPERLPGAVMWVTKTMRQVRDYASGATQQLKDELGPEFDDLRQPLSEINKLRGMTPRSVITKHLLDGDDSIFTGNFDRPSLEKPKSAEMPPTSGKPLNHNERPPIDPDAT